MNRYGLGVGEEEGRKWIRKKGKEGGERGKGGGKEREREREREGERERERERERESGSVYTYPSARDKGEKRMPSAA